MIEIICDGCGNVIDRNSGCMGYSVFVERRKILVSLVEELEDYGSCYCAKCLQSQVTSVINDYLLNNKGGYGNVEKDR